MHTLKNTSNREKGFSPLKIENMCVFLIAFAILLLPQSLFQYIHSCFQYH
jgi:hypothetical protein